MRPAKEVRANDRIRLVPGGSVLHVLRVRPVKHNRRPAVQISVLNPSQPREAWCDEMREIDEHIVAPDHTIYDA